MVNPGSEQPQLCAARNSVTGILSVNAIGSVRQSRLETALRARGEDHLAAHDDGTDYLVMELLEGESLAERLKRGPRPLKELIAIGCDIADALDRAHRGVSFIAI